MSTMGGDMKIPGEVLAFDLTKPGTLKWKASLRHDARLGKPNVHIRYISVGPRGRLFGVGHALHFGGSTPVVFAMDDKGKMLWDPPYVEPHGWPSREGKVPGGIALREEDGKLKRLYVTTTHIRNANGVGGKIFAIAPDSGKVLHAFDPSKRQPKGIGSMTPPTIGANGTIYVGSRGKHPHFRQEGIDGRMYALSYRPRYGFRVLWEMKTEGQLDWVPPAIGANGAIYFGTSASYPPAKQAKWFGWKDTPADMSPKFYAIFE